MVEMGVRKQLLLAVGQPNGLGEPAHTSRTPEHELLQPETEELWSRRDS